VTLTLAQWEALGMTLPAPPRPPYCGVWTPGTRPPAACGTEGGWDRHRRLGIPACGPCTEAHARAERLRRARRQRRRLGLVPTGRLTF